MRVAIMQPAFIPPASYFRLFAASDIFVVYDDVQFDRRWYTHRQKLTNRNGEKEWLTLPLKKQPRDTTKICHIHWSDNIKEEWKKRIQKFPIFDNHNEMVRDLKILHGYWLPSVFLSFHLFRIKLALGLCSDRIADKNFLNASEFNVPVELRGQNRILAICKKLGATEYINSPGGKHLYDENAFTKEGIKLTFLPDWHGSYDSILERLAHENPEDIRREIYEQI